MGINLKDLVPSEKISLKELAGKKVAIDTFNILYQFLSAIRDKNGELFRDKKGRITSHLMGLFYRTASLLEAGVYPCFVFDGKPVELKAGTSTMRRELRELAAQLFEKAKLEGDSASARKYGQQALKVTDEIINEAKEFVRLLGLPVVQAVHDGEAQAAWMCKEGEVDAVASQDWDCVLFGAPVFIRNLTAGGKVELQRIVLKDALKELGLKQEELVEAAILIGTDFNTGVKGIGPKTAVKLAKEGKVKEYKKEIEAFDTIKKIFLKPETKKVKLEWGKLDRSGVIDFLLERGFSKERVEKTLDKIAPKQKGLGAFF